MCKSESKKPVSEKQLAANRANAAKSTGPTSEDGKARSSRNSAQHGFSSTSFTVVRLEDIDEIARLRTDLIALYQPVNFPVTLRPRANSPCASRLCSAPPASKAAGSPPASTSPSAPTVPPTSASTEGITYALEITMAQNRNYCLADGFLHLARQGKAFNCSCATRHRPSACTGVRGGFRAHQEAPPRAWWGRRFRLPTC